MATKSLSVRIPEEALAELEKMAAAREQNVSGLVRDLILDALKRGEAGTSGLMARLEQLETNIMGSQSWLGDFVVMNLRATAEARYQAQMAADNAEEIINYLANSKPLDAKTKRERQQMREMEAVRQGDSLVEKATILASAGPVE